ncbi:MAG: hypothetical protein H9W81_17425 [Enterococcus sp.]|nr:hypothetical protein [Enterococcus sp.]
MSSIIESTVANAANLVASYEQIVGDIAGVAKNLRESLLQNGTIVSIPQLSDKEAGEVSLCAIDGASASDKMQSADLLMAGATLHDGIRSKVIFENNEDAPSLGYSDIRIHSSKNEELLSSIRAYTEIWTLGASPHDISIIDGAYLGNFLTVLYRLQESKQSAEGLIEFMKKNNDGYFVKGLIKIFDLVSRENDKKDVIALAKSDSSRDMVKTYADGAPFFVTDKILAEHLLKPGEMILPLAVNANKDKVSLLEYNQENRNWAGFKWNPRSSLSPEDFTVMEDVFTLDQKDKDKYLFSLYTYLYDSYFYTYFKPYNFMEGSHALRMEFTTRKNDKNDIGTRLVSHVDADVKTPAIKEPISQYMVDKVIKKPISTSMKYMKASIPTMVNQEYNPQGLISSYRT